MEDQGYFITARYKQYIPFQMNPIVILVLLIVILVVVQVVLYKISIKVKHSKPLILLSYLVLYLLVLPLLLPVPPSSAAGSPACGMPMVAVMFGRIVLAVLGVIFTLVTHATYRAIAKTNKFVKQQKRP